MIKHHICLSVGFLLPSNIYIRFSFPLFKEADQLQTFQSRLMCRINTMKPSHEKFGSLAHFVSYIMLPICKGDASEDESPQPDVRNDSDSSYLGDVESLSCDSAEPSSDSEGDLSEMFSKGNIRKHLLKLFIC